MRKFKHKPSGEIFTQKNDLEMIGLKDSESDGFTLPTWLLEQGNDWEEVKEEVKPKGPIFGVSVMKEEPNYLITAFRCLDLENKSLIRLCHDGKYFDNVVRACGLYTLEDMLYKSPSVQSGNFEIYSVKNSEGEEFLLNEVVKFSNVKLPITKFEISKINGQMDVILRNENRYSLEAIEKLKSPIYTTTDGVDIYEGDYKTVYLISKDNPSDECKVCAVLTWSKEDSKVADRYLTFTSEENRDKYIKESRKKAELDEHNKIMKEKIDKEFNKKPIFVSADGKEFYDENEDYTLFSVCPKSNWQENRYRLKDVIKFPKLAWLHFHTKEARQEYIDNNKPRFSLADIKKVHDDIYGIGDVYGVISALKKLGK